MTIRVRTGLMLIVVLATMSLASCGHYTCGANFGVSTCTGGPPSLSGGNGNSAAAFVFVANGSATGTVVGYTLNTNVTPPTLAFTPNYNAPATVNNDAGVGMAVAQKKFLYAAFGSTNQIFGWSIDTAGSLTAVSGSPVNLPVTFVTAGTSTFDTRRVTTNPAGTLLFIADEFGNQIFVYQIGSGGVLAAVTGSPFSTGTLSPGNLTTDGLGNFLYVTETFSDHTGDAIETFSIGTGGGLGVLTAVGNPLIGSPYDMWQLQGEPTGKFLIGTKGFSSAVNSLSDPNLYVFSIGPSGAISFLASSPTTNSPFSMAVQQNTGTSLIYTFGQNTATAFNSVEGYTLSSSGSLTPLSSSPFTAGAVGSEGQFDQSGSLLFDYGGLFDINTIVYRVTALDVSSGNLTVPTGTGTYGGYWVGTDAP